MMGSGYWLPELIEAAGCEPVAAHVKTPVLEVSELEVADVLIFACCGFGVERSAREISTCGLLDAGSAFMALPAAKAGQVYIADGCRSGSCTCV